MYDLFNKPSTRSRRMKKSQNLNKDSPAQHAMAFRSNYCDERNVPVYTLGRYSRPRLIIICRIRKLRGAAKVA
jgi:hypothetical protein